MIAATVLAFGSAACGPAESASSSGEATAGPIVVDEVWIRPTPPVSNVGAFYLTITNRGDEADRVVGASAPRCDEIEIHRTETVDGVSSMARVIEAELEVAAGGGLAFEPSGLHVMCLGLDEPVLDGELLVLTVELERAGPVTVEAVAENR